jgi:hypothetical protein
VEPSIASGARDTTTRTKFGMDVQVSPAGDLVSSGLTFTSQQQADDRDRPTGKMGIPGSHFRHHALHLLNERATPVCSPLRAVAAEAMVVDNGFGWVK